MPGFARFYSTKGALRLTELDVVALEVEDLGAAKDGHVLELSLPDSRAVVTKGLAASHNCPLGVW